MDLELHDEQIKRVKWIVTGLNYDCLTDWELKRVEEWEKRLDDGYVLTDRQMEVLEKLYSEKGK